MQNFNFYLSSCEEKKEEVMFHASFVLIYKFYTSLFVFLSFADLFMKQSTLMELGNY